jgi:hypothetical protein
MLHGNLHNRLMERSKPVTPEVGMGATIIMYSDRHAATIVRIKLGGSMGNPTVKRVQIQEDRSIRTDANGMCDSQDYRYERNTMSPLRWFSLRKNGRYVEEGSDMKNGTSILIGERDSYHDCGF